MIKASELRLGNYVWNETQEILVQVDLKILSEQLYGFVPPWKPVVLTEERLFMFGFFSDNRNGYRLIDMYSLSFSITKEGEFCPCWQDRVLSKVETKYVHQLQNLYFALKGEELQIINNKQ